MEVGYINGKISSTFRVIKVKIIMSLDPLVITNMYRQMRNHYHIGKYWGKDINVEVYQIVPCTVPSGSPGLQPLRLCILDSQESDHRR